jgi:hypothetical protein
MNEGAFDRFTRLFGRLASRRATLGSVAGGWLAMLGGVERDSEARKKPKTVKCKMPKVR